MKFNKKMILPFVLVLFYYSPSSEACTSFVLQRNDTCLLAKNLDWPIGDGIIIVNRRGETKYAFPNDNNPFQWQARYGSITFNQFGKEFPLGGMNEMGLVIEELSYSLSEYPPAQKNIVNEFQWIQYHLDNFSTVSEVIENLENITLEPLIAKLHYMICDREGYVAIIEFIDGKIDYYTGHDVVVPVLTNNSYRNSLEYLKHHEGFGGSRVVSDGPESPERFVRAATLIQNFNDTKDEPSPDKAFQFLNAVEQNDTQWSIVYDLTHASIYFKTKQITSRQKIELADFDFSAGSKIFNLQLHDSENLKPGFHDYSYDENIELLQSVFEQLITLDELPERKAGLLIKTLEDYHRAVK